MNEQEFEDSRQRMLDYDRMQWLETKSDRGTITVEERSELQELWTEYRREEYG